MELRKLNPGEFGDVIAIRDSKDPFKRETNITHFIRQSQDFEWGYGGTGPSDFAVNILFHFSNGNDAFARRNYREFLEQYIRHMPRKGGTIHKESILVFIEERAPLSVETTTSN